MNRNKSKFFVKLAIVVFCAVASITSFSNRVFADYEWSSGGQAGGAYGSGGPDYDSYYDCTGSNLSRCPRWILVPNSVYQIIRNEKRMVGTYSSLPVCESDKYLMIAGNQRADGSLQIFNINSGDRPAPVKETHVHTSVAKSINTTDDYFNRWDESIGERNSKNFFSWENANGVKGNDGHILTYQEVLNEVVRRSGISEINLAVACPSMVEVTRTLTGHPVDTSGNSITTDGTNWSSTVTSGSSASISAGWNAYYNFKGWCTNRPSSSSSCSPSGDTTYTVNSLTENKDVYAVYEKKKFTLTGKSVDASGNSLSSVSGLEDKTATAEYNSGAEITRGTNAGYTFLGWRTNKTSGTPSGSAKYTVSHLTDNIIVYAVYEKKKVTLTGESISVVGNA